MEFKEHMTIFECNYQLISFSSHIGKTVHGGHYVSHKRVSLNGADMWYYCNDKEVSQIGLAYSSDVAKVIRSMSKNVTLLLYMKTKK